jgi:hypothetical protein
MDNSDLFHLLKMAFWDIDIEASELTELLYGKVSSIGPITRKQLFLRLLTSYDWYTLLKLLPAEALHDALSSDIIDHIWPPDLKKRLSYARDVLLYG